MLYGLQAVPEALVFRIICRDRGIFYHALLQNQFCSNLLQNCKIVVQGFNYRSGQGNGTCPELTSHAA